MDGAVKADRLVPEERESHASTMWVLVQDIQERVLNEIKSIVPLGTHPVGLGVTTSLKLQTGSLEPCGGIARVQPPFTTVIHDSHDSFAREGTIINE